MNAPEVALSWLRSTPLAYVRLHGLAVDAGAVREAGRAIVQVMQPVRRYFRLEHEAVEAAGQKSGCKSAPSFVVNT